MTDRRPGRYDGAMDELSMIVGALRAAGPQIKSFFQAEHTWVPALVVSAFTLVNSFRVFAYLPQILKAARTHGAAGVSLTTWGLFLLANLTTTLYAVVCLGDLVMAVIFLGNAFACIAIIAVAVFKRRRHEPMISESVRTVIPLRAGAKRRYR